MTDIAVVGISLRFPGDATSVESLWDVLERGESQWSEFPKDRLNIDGYFHPGGDRQGSISFKGGHFLGGNIAAFDAPFFSIPADDAKAIDPQQRILLETSYEALENAGIRKEDVDGSDTAVYVGSFVKDYEQICLRDPDWAPQYAATGNGTAILSNRISYAFNFHGPSMTIDTGCSGSLVTVHLAAQSLLNNECSLAIAGGVGLILTPNTIMPMTALNFLSPDGKCFTFDSRANGYGRGEGIGVVVLKRLSDAIRDNDTIRAVIRGSRVNQDGRTSGITLPSKEAQVANIRSLYSNAGLSFDQTAYVECHGTGTQAGDWRELKAISETLASTRAEGKPIVVGSIKPNIGHLEGAAGVAGFIKGVMMLEKGKIPPNINFETGNPSIDFENWGVEVPRKVMDWPLPGLRRVSVNCFGFGGTNAHVIVDEAPAYLSDRGMQGHHNSLVATANGGPPAINGSTPDTRPQVFAYSSNEKPGLDRVLQAHREFLASREESDEHLSLEDYSYTLGCRRSCLEWKTTIVAASAKELISKIDAIDQSQFVRSSPEKKNRVCFVFSGQGSQWAGMGKALMEYGSFRESLLAANQFMSSRLECSFDLVGEMFKDENESRVSRPEISQPATTALQVALVELLSSVGILPRFVVGHSSGEIAAAFASGAISREAAWEIAYLRGLMAAKIPVKSPHTRGKMIAVGMSLEHTREYLDSIDKLAEVACINSPRSVTVSGFADDIDWLAKDLERKGVFQRILPVDIAYHSSYMKLVEEDYLQSLGRIESQQMRDGVTMFSSVTGQPIDGTELGPSYWVENMVSKVDYLSAVSSMMHLPSGERPNMIVELSPQGSLRSPTSDILSSLKLTIPYLTTLKRKVETVVPFLEAAGSLWTRGQSVRMDSLISRGRNSEKLKCLVDLPSHCWNHTKSYWHESHLGHANRFRKYPRQDIIGAPVVDSLPYEPRWRGFLRVSENPWLQDHQVQKSIIYPASGFITMVLEGAKQMTDEIDAIFGYEISNMRIHKAMLIPTTEHGLETSLSIKRGAHRPESTSTDGIHEFSIDSKALNGPWERNATGSVRFVHKQGDWTAPLRTLDEKLLSASEACSEPVVSRQLYELLDTVGMNYGPLFQNITSVRRGGNACVSEVRVPDTKSKMPAKFEYPHIIHPATLDSMIQTLFAIEAVPMVPTFVERLFVAADLGQSEGGHFSGCSTAGRSGINGARADIFMRKDGGESYLSIEGLHLTSLAGSMPQDRAFLPNHRNLCTQIVWEEDVTTAKPEGLPEFLSVLAHQSAGLRILLVGGYDLTEAILGTIASPEGGAPRLSRLTLLDLGDDSEAELAISRTQGTPMQPFVERVEGSNLGRLPEYHLILIMDNRGNGIGGLETHLLPGGFLLRRRLNARDLEGSKWPLYGSLDVEVNGELMHSDIFRMPMQPTADENQVPEVVLLYHDGCGTTVASFIADFSAFIKQQNPKIVISHMPLVEASSNLSFIRGKVVISLLDFINGSDEDGFVFSWDRSGFECFHALQKSAKGILWVTQGAHMKPSYYKRSPIVALARTLMSEDPVKTIITVDLDFTMRLDDTSWYPALVSIFSRGFCEAEGPGPREVEYAVADGKLYIPHLTTVDSLNRLIEGDEAAMAKRLAPFNIGDRLAMSRTGLSLSINKPGTEEDGLAFTEYEVKPLQPSQVELDFLEAPLTFSDIDTVQGLTGRSDIGIDLIGRVRRVGDSVHDIQPGEIVVAMATEGSVRNTVSVDRGLVAPAAEGFVPSLFFSAYYGLIHMGRLRPGGKVLLHAAASCYGMAALHICALTGAEIYGTVFGSQSDQQLEILSKAGLPKERIFDATSENFIASVVEATAGTGVDIMYNPTQHHQELLVRCVRRGGTSIQFHDGSSAKGFGLSAAPIGGTLVNLDLQQMLKEEPQFVASVFDIMLNRLKDSNANFTQLSPPPQRFPVSKLADALKHIEQSRYIGYASVTTSDSVHVLPTDATQPLRESVDPQGTYVLAGGLGGLGCSIANLLVDNGAKHLAFISRSGASSSQTRDFLYSLVCRGVDARTYRVDLCDGQAMKRFVKDTISREMPPLRGVFQCAAVIKDAVFDNMTYENWTAAISPKTVGSLNLVESMLLTGQEPFFVFLASSAGVIGSRGQANYAAGNGFEDAFAHFYRQQGRRAVSVDLGPVLGAGMLADDEATLDMLRASGFYGIRHQDFIKVIEHAITMEITPGIPMPPQVILGVGTGGLMLQNQPADPYWSRTALYSYLNLVDMPAPDLSKATSAEPDVDMKTRLSRCTDAADAESIICIGLAHMLAKAMNLLYEDMDVNKSPSAYGVDSLVAVGVRNWVLNNCAVEVSVFEILSDKTVSEIATMVAEKGGFGVDLGT